MSLKQIKRDDSAFVLSSNMPSEWKFPTAVTAVITDKAGTELVASTAAALYDGDTLNAAVLAGSLTAVLATGNALSPGQVVVIGDDEDGYQENVVERYDTDTETATFEERFDRPFKDGSTVYGRGMSITIDTSTDAWDNITDVLVAWTPDSDDIAWNDEWTTLSRARQSTELATSFRKLYTRYHEIVADSFNYYYEAAIRDLSVLIEPRGQNIDKIVDSGKLDNLIMVTIACQVAVGMSDRFEGELENLKSHKAEIYAAYMLTRTWVDDNEDKIEDEGEVEAGQIFWGKQL